MIITAVVFVLYVMMPSVIGSKKNKSHFLGKHRSYEAWDRSRDNRHRLSH